MVEVLKWLAGWVAEKVLDQAVDAAGHKLAEGPNGPLGGGGGGGF